MRPTLAELNAAAAHNAEPMAPGVSNNCLGTS